MMRDMMRVREFIDAIITQLNAITSFVGVNILDAIVVVILVFYAYEGYTLGLLLSGVDLLSFILSFIVALKFYAPFGMFLADVINISPAFARAIGFFILALFSEIVINILLRYLFKRVPDIQVNKSLADFFRDTNHIFGIIPGLISAFIILAFLLSVIISLPSSPKLKQLVTTSFFGEHLVANAASFEKNLNDIFGGALNETMNFLTVKPSSTETIDLRFTVNSATVDGEAEEEMLRLVNKERVAAGIHPLVMDTKLRAVARAYSKDMFERGYFSHYNPEGESPFDRMDKAKVTYGYAGENLALAPSTQLAMQGLMNSPGHRANILNANFNKVGIGAMDGGIYGKMYSQEFTD